MKTDCYGAPVSFDDQNALDGLNAAQRKFRGFFGDPVAMVDAVIAEHPDFVMAHCFRGGLFVTSSEAAGVGEIRTAMKAIEENWADANDRERGHYAGMAAWSVGDFHRAANIYGRVAAAYPRDAIALQFAHLCDFLNGHATLLRDRVAGILPQWSPEDEGYGYLLGMKAFGLEETGAYDWAEEAGRQAVVSEPADPWAIHAVAHVMEMQGRHIEGTRWLESTSQHWSDDCFFGYHNWWHLSLYLLETEDYPRVLDLYDQVIRNANSPVAMELVDAVALLWRLTLRGVNVGDRWQELSKTYELMEMGGYYAFNDMHAVIAHSAADRAFAAEQCLEKMRDAVRGFDTNSMMTADVGLPAAEAMQAFLNGNYRQAVDKLYAVRGVAHHFGGSNAQRDILGLTLVEAAIRGGQHGLAVSLASERMGAKPTSPTNRMFLDRAWGAAGPNQVAVANVA